MDYFSLLSDIACLAGQSIMHLLFTSKLSGKKPMLWLFPVYFLLIWTIDHVSIIFLPEGGILPVGAGVLALACASRYALKNRWHVSWLAAVLSFYISQLSFGVINSVEAVVFPRFIGSPLLYLLLIAALLIFFLLCACCYRGVIKLMPGADSLPRLGLLLFPSLFFFAAELYILRTSYSLFTPSASPMETGRHAVLLFLQVMGLAAMLCTLYAYRQLCQGFRDSAALQSLTQAAQAQKVYISEARSRYEQTMAFRHDVKNHLAVLSSLLNSGKIEESREYLQKLSTVSDSLSFPCRTGNAVVDILLGEKLGLLKDVRTEVSLLLPNPCGIDDLDLCVIFANALDNAIIACQSLEGEKHIQVSGQQQGDFFMLTFENSCTDGPTPVSGTGLANIRAAAEKYHGAALFEKSGRSFSLSVLLDISRHR